MCNRRKQRQICSCDWHPWVIPTCRHGRWSTHAFRGDNRAKLIIRLEPSIYRKHIWYNRKGKPILYVQLKSIIWYATSGTSILETVIQHITGVGFTINNYDQCEANKIIKGKQCTIIWHIDNLKISHVDKRVVEDILKWLTTKFGQGAPLTTCRGKILDYLGMKIEYRR